MCDMYAGERVCKLVGGHLLLVRVCDEGLSHLQSVVCLIEGLGAPADFSKLPLIKKAICISTFTYRIQRRIGRRGMHLKTHTCTVTSTSTKPHTHIHTHKHRGVKKQPQATLLYSSIHIFFLRVCVCVSLSHSATMHLSLVLSDNSGSLPLYLCLSRCVFISVRILVADHK